MSDAQRDRSKPVTLRRRRTPCRNQVLAVHLDHIIDYTGQEILDFMVVEPLTHGRDGVTGVAVLPLYRGRVALLHVYRHPIGAFGWEVPRGFVDAAEEPAHAARRELREETGFDCAQRKLIEAGTLEPEPGILRATTKLFVATACRRLRPWIAEELGHGELRLFHAEEAERMVRSGAIREAATLVLVLKWRSDPKSKEGKRA